MAFAEVNGARLLYRIDGPMSGPADAPVLMLCNSLGTDHTMWDPQVPALARKLRVLRYDRRGHGGSAVTPGPYTIEQLGRDALGLLDALGLDRVRYCGLSLGGMTGMWLGTHAGKRIEKLVLCNTAAQIGSPEPWNARIEAVRRGGMAAIESAVMARWFTPRFLAQPTPMLGRMREVFLQLSPEGYVAACAAVRDMDQRESIARIAAPTLVIAGTHDASTTPAAGQFIASEIPGARYAELDAAHISNVEAADHFTETVLGFVAD
jgi:3-oxoadipate enol-lactonase